MTLSLHDIQQAIQPAGLRSDPPRHEERLRVKINARAKTSIPGMHTLAPAGIQEVVIYRSDLPALQSKVEDQEAFWAECHTRCDTEREAWIAERMTGTPAHRQDLRRAELIDHWRRDTTISTTPEGFFFARNKRGIKPLIGAVEVVEDGIEPPRTEEQARFEAIIAKMDGQQVAMVNALATAITDGIAKLTAALSENKGGGQQRR